MVPGRFGQARLSRLSVPGQNVLAWDRKAYLCFQIFIRALYWTSIKRYWLTVRVRLTEKARLVQSIEKYLRSATNSDHRPLLLIDEAMGHGRVEHTKLVDLI